MGVRSLISQAIYFSSVFIPVILAGHRSTAHLGDVCAEKKCNPNGPAVRFPFLLQGKQPEYCGYSLAYLLYCDENNRTILKLPSSSLKVEVSHIEYWSQMMEIQSLEYCFAKDLRDLDISTTPFQFSPTFFYSNSEERRRREQLNLFKLYQYSLFNCSSMISSRDAYGDWTNIHCLSDYGRSYNVYAILRNKELRKLSGLVSCTKMYDTKLLPDDIFDSSTTYLSWSLPECERCELQGGICRWKNGTSHIIGCFGRKKHHSGILRVLHISGPIIGCLLLVLTIGAIYLLFSKMEQHKENQLRIKKFLEDYAAMKPTRYSYADIKKITNDFKDKLGEGSYGNVFKGQVSNEIFVAVKLLHESTGNGEEFINEVGTMGTIHHVNVARLLGFCADGYKRALVYEFLPNGSLDKFIFPEGQEHHTLGMDRLQDIAIGIARGIQYLHQGCQQRILHFDIKPHNILLDDNYNPKISDFGLAKLCEKGKSAVSMTAARGTMGYIAPEVFSRQFGNVSYKSDIYSLGILLLEMVGQRKNIDTSVQNISQVYFPEWVYGRLVNGEEFKIQVEEDGQDETAKKLAIVGLWCIQWNPVDRPSMTSVCQMLEGSGEDLSLPPNPFTSGSAMNPAHPIEHRRPLGSGLTAIAEVE